MSMNRATRRREKRLLKNQRLAIFFLPEIFELILNQLPLPTLLSCSLVCHHWYRVVQNVLSRHPVFDTGQKPPFMVPCDWLYNSRDNVRIMAEHIWKYMQTPAPGGKRTVNVVTSKRYSRLRYWETYAAACHDLAAEIATLGTPGKHNNRNDGVVDIHNVNGNDGRHLGFPDPSPGDQGVRPVINHRLTGFLQSSAEGHRMSFNKSSNVRHLTLLNFGFMELLSPIPMIRVFGVQKSLTSLTLRMSEHLDRLFFLPSLQQRSVSGAELFFTLQSLPNLCQLEIESTHYLETIVDKRNVYYYLGRSTVSIDRLRKKICGEESPDASDWDTLEGFLLPDIPRRPHGFEEELKQYSAQWLLFLEGGDRDAFQKFNIRRLRLADVAIEEQHLLAILSRCPYLEELIMDGISWHSTVDLATTLNQSCPRLHTLRLLRVHQSSYTLCTDILKCMPTLKTIIMDEHDIDLFEYAPRSSTRRNANNHINNSSSDGNDGNNNSTDESSDNNSVDGDDGDEADQGEDGDDDNGPDITLRERHEAIRFYWRVVLQANFITRLVLTPTAETGRTLGQAHLHTIHCRHVMAIDLHNFLCLAPHLLHLEASSTLLFEDMILPKKRQFHQHHRRHSQQHYQRQALPTHGGSDDALSVTEDMDVDPASLSADEHLARLLQQKRHPTSWVCHKLHTLQLSIWSEGAGDSLASCDTTALFGFLARTCPDLEHISLRRKALALQEGLGFGLDELSRLKRLRVLELSVNSLLAFNKTQDVAWIFDRKKTTNRHGYQNAKHQHGQQQQSSILPQQPTSADLERGGLFGRRMELFKVNYKTLLGGKTLVDSRAVDKAFNLPFAFTLHKD